MPSNFQKIMPYLLSLLVVLFISAASLNAAETGTVTATVTVQNVSLNVSDGEIEYGTLNLDGTEDTTTNGLSDSQTVTNDGNVTETFNIQGQNSSPWTLSATAGADDYVHEFCTTDCDADPTWTALTTSDQELATGIAASGGTQVFDLKITMPSSSTSYDPQNVDVTVTAVAE